MLVESSACRSKKVLDPLLPAWVPVPRAQTPCGFLSIPPNCTEGALGAGVLHASMGAVRYLP